MKRVLLTGALCATLARPDHEERDEKREVLTERWEAWTQLRAG